ncbi:CHAT domain-containing protein [Microbispora sp. NEAU-D428]|uniref:CHAT domain-containing protein n=1 Tax=Microbispora sitophila TaxID=2771537 RepID=UPI0018682E3F|nr:CHAT domain-containing protein [Microbispora sitophila]MBE3015088.1 CHAT domain-containing protein [Microbispora sitophila]
MGIRGALRGLRLNLIARRIRRRLVAYERTGDARTVLADAALADALRLWHGAVRREPADMTDLEREWLFRAHIAIGWLFHARWVATQSNFELSQAVFHLAPVAHIPDVVPEPLRQLIGPDADPEVQAGTATVMLAELHTTSEPSYLTAVITLLAQAAAGTPAGSPALPLLLTNLGVAYRHRYQRHGNPGDLDTAASATQEALSLVSASSGEWFAVATNLTAVYQQRYELRGDVADLDEAIRLGDQVVETAPDDHPLLLVAISYLGIGYQLRYLRDGGLTDLLRAITLTETSVEATHPDDPDRPGRLNNLSIALLQRYQRLGNVSDLDRAIELSEESLAAVPDDHPERVIYLRQLVAVLARRHEHGGDPATLDRAIEIGEQGLALVSGDADQAKQLADLALGYLWRYERSGDAADLGRAGELAQNALRRLPDGHPATAAIVSIITDIHSSRRAAGSLAVKADELRHLAELARGAVRSVPSHSVRAFAKLARLAGDLGDLSLTADLYAAAVALLPAAVSRRNARVDQEERVGEYPDLVGEAVAAHLAAGDPAGAVAVAEQGRGILLAEEVDLHADLAELAAREPGLAERFRDVRDRLRATSQVSPGGFMVYTTDLVNDRTRLWAEYDDLVKEIRCGFPRFLGQLDLTELRAAAGGGAVVLVNSARSRGDAIIITTEDITPVALPDLSWADVAAHVAELVIAMQASADGTLTGALRMQRVVKETLEWLSATIAGPIGAALSGVDRVWWLPIGMLGVLPLHTALPDHVVSSYTSTLRALARARSRTPATVRHQLTVAVSSAPELPTLTGTAQEAEALHQRHPGILLVDEDATTDRVLAELPGRTWAHFACHAATDAEKPSFGGLVLHDTLLPIGAIGALPLDQAELAYLSACSTAFSGIFHANESIHLASAFQLAGFRHVVGSQWLLDDATAAAVAREFYRQLPGPDANEAARVLHRVMGDLRRTHPDRPDLWAALVHYGP